MVSRHLAASHAIFGHFHLNSDFPGDIYTNFKISRSQDSQDFNYDFPEDLGVVVIVIEKKKPFLVIMG